MYPTYDIRKTLKKSARTALLTLIPVIAGDAAFEAVQVELIGAVVIPVVTAVFHGLFDAFKHGAFKRNPFRSGLGILVAAGLGLCACQTSLNQPIAPENIAVMQLLLDTARTDFFAAWEEARIAKQADDEARLVQAQRRIDMALATIREVSAMMEGVQPQGEANE